MFIYYAYGLDNLVKMQLSHISVLLSIPVFHLKKKLFFGPDGKVKPLSMQISCVVKFERKVILKI